MEAHFATERATITPLSKATVSGYRFRFVRPDLAFVDAVLELTNVRGAGGQMQRTVSVVIVFTAVPVDGEWLIQDERAFRQSQPCRKPL